MLTIQQPSSDICERSDDVVTHGLLMLMWRCAQIVLTIHQPSSDICERFDDLILLSCGRMLYCGPWGDADTYFASAGFECAHRLHPMPPPSPCCC